MFKFSSFVATALSCFACLPLPSFGVDSYSIHFPSLANDQSYACAINAHGTVVGKAEKEKGYLDFIWFPKTGIQRFTFNASSSFPVINNLNKVFGTGWFAVPSWWSSHGSFVKSFYSINSQYVLREINPPNFFPSLQQVENSQLLRYLDNHELAVLSCNDSGELLIADFFDPSHAKKFAVSILQDLDTTSENFWSRQNFSLIDEKILSQANFMNHRRMILGKCWQQGKKGMLRYIAIYDLTTQGVTPLFVDKGYTLSGFNDAGQICGWKMTHQTDELEGFLWDPEKGFQFLGDFLPHALNNRGQMVGNIKTEANSGYYLSDYPNAIEKLDALKFYVWHPCVWLNGEAVPIQDLLSLDTLPCTILNLNGINDEGKIIGNAFLDKRRIQAIVLTPIDTEEIALIDHPLTKHEIATEENEVVAHSVP